MKLTQLSRDHLIVLFSLMCVCLASCRSSDAPLHDGRVPFRWMESVPAGGEAAFSLHGMHLPGQKGSHEMIAAVRAGDVVAFHMSHAEARAYLRRGTIQKLPYELFRYGHVALVVPSDGEWRLLQIAMGQKADMSSGPEYLKDKSWSLFRPRAGDIDLGRLRAFCQIVTDEKAAAYDMTATLGLRNRGLEPDEGYKISPRYTCATLVIAALHYAGYPLRVTRCGGVMDIITPGQVVRAKVGFRKQPSLQNQRGIRE